MRTFINYTIRFAALLSAVSLLSMLIGWISVDISTVSIDVIMLAIWISTEYEIRVKGKDSQQR